jgi:hypothetical protein
MIERPALETCAGPLPDPLVGLAEELAPLRMPDDRSVDPQLEQHRRGDLAGERALCLPMNVLGSDRDFRPGERLHRRAQRQERRADGDIDAVEPLELVTELATERRRLLGPLYIFQLPAISIGWILVGRRNRFAPAPR